MARARVKHGRWWRWPLYGLAGFVVLLGVLAGALFVGLQTSWAREQIRQQVNSGLAEVFQGKLQLERLGRVTLWGVSGVDARVFDAKGQQIVRAQGLSASASLAGLGWQLATRSDAPELYIAAVHIDHADVTLREDEEVGVTLASAFLPRPTAVPAPPSPPGSGPRLHVGRLTFDSVWAHGRASGSPPLDAELRRLKASLKQSPRDGFALDLASVDLVTRGLPLAADPRGNVTGIVESPPDGAGPLRLEVTLDGQAAGSPLALEASWVGDDLHARVNLPHLPAAFVNRQAPTLLLDGDVALAADVDGPLPQLDFQAEIVATAGHVLATGYAVVAQGLELGATVEATDLNLARVVPTAPPSALSLRTRALLLEQQDGHFALGYRLDVEPGQVAAQATPALWLTGRAELDADTGVVGAGKLGASEAGTSLLGAYRVALPRERGGEVALSLDARLDDPQRLAALGIHTAGTASVVGQLDLERSAVAAKASLSLGRVDQALVQARNVEVMAQLSGSLDDPRVHAAATLDVLSGRAHADLDYSSRAERLELFVADVDLLRLSHTLGVKLPLEHGTLGLDAVVTRSAPSPRYQLEATAQAELGKLGALKLVAHELELPTAAPSLSRLSALRGQLIVSGNVELETLSPLLTAAGVPIERTTGHVRFEAEAKQSADATQGLQLSAQVDTNGLRVVQQRKTADELKTTADAIDSGPVALEGIDLHLSLHAWPQSGEVVGTLLLRDPGGTLLETQAEAQLAGVWPAGLTDVEALSRVPLKVTLEVPRRRLQSLPALLRPAALRGRFALAAEGEGSLVDPHFKAQISVESLRAAGSKAPIDAAADVIYAPDGGSARIDAKMTSTALAVATVNTTWRGDLRRAGELAGGATGITASADVSLVDFPLDVVPLIVDRQVNGRVSGELKLTNWGSDARVDASFSSTSLVVGKFPIQELKLAARTEAGKLLAELGVKAGSGTSKGTLDAGMHWGKRPLPELEHRGTAKLATTAFKLETLSPLLGAYVSEIGGVLDANTEISVTPTTTALSGTAKLEKGVVQLPAIGQRFSDISARVAVADNQFKLERLEARGTTGRVTMKGAARLDGFALRGADAQIAIAKNESLPLTLEGAAIGDAWGNVNAVYKSPAQGEKQLDIDVPEFHLVTPETGGGSIQSLDANEEIHVGVRRADGKFVSLPVQPLEPSSSDATAAEPAQPLRIHVKLGRNISVERGRSAQAQLTGQLTILVAGTTEVDGRIEVRGGKLDVQGKTFEIERGVVTFDGNDPGNPTITATARWDAPGYTVYADYLGDVQNGRIKLHSEPPLTQDEIASLLLFGSPEGSVGGSGSSNAALAVSVAGDTAAKGLNQVLDDFTNLDVSARIDTTTGSARPELVFQVSPRVSAKVTRAVGAPALGESPDRTFLTLELRLKRAWALSALFGDRGASALDLIWRRRY